MFIASWCLKCRCRSLRSMCNHQNCIVPILNLERAWMYFVLSTHRNTAQNSSAVLFHFLIPCTLGTLLPLLPQSGEYWGALEHCPPSPSAAVPYLQWLIQESHLDGELHACCLKHCSSEGVACSRCPAYKWPYGSGHSHIMQWLLTHMCHCSVGLCS